MQELKLDIAKISFLYYSIESYEILEALTCSTVK